MKTIVFDLDGVLRARRTPDLAWYEKRRDYAALRALYCLCMGAPDWRVAIVTQEDNGQADTNQVRAGLVKLTLPEPNVLRMVARSETKQSVYAELKPDIVIDDEIGCIDLAIQEGATTLRVR